LTTSQGSKIAHRPNS